MQFIKRNSGLIIIFVFGLIPLFPLFHSGLPQTHDGQDHVARIANFYISLSEGNIIPRWAGNLNWGYGHPILMFLYPLPSYFASFFHFLGFSLVDSVKIVFGFSFVLSGVTMYLWMRNVLGEKAGILSGVLYMLAPYRLVDLYVRGAIGEHTAFIFAPLVFYFILQISIVRTKPSIFYKLGFSFSIAFLLLSHNALAVMFLPFAFVYALILMIKSKNRLTLAISYSLFAFLGFGLSAFFLIPAFMEGKYTLRDIVTGKGEYKSSFVNLKDFFIPSWSFGGTNFLSKQIGLVQMFPMILSIIAINKIKKSRELSLYVLSGIVLIGSIFLMTSGSNLIWEKITLIQKFQFPWRLLSLVVFAVSVISSFSTLIFKNKKHMGAFVLLVCVLALSAYFPYYKVQGFIEKPESFYTGIYKSTTDTGESSPIWSVRFMEKEASAPAEFILGGGSIDVISRNSITRTYKITSNSSARIRENTLYFPNWEVAVNGRKTEIEFQDPGNRGLITYSVPRGENIVEIKFRDTKLRTISNIISLISIIALGIIFIYAIRVKKK